MGLALKDVQAKSSLKCDHMEVSAGQRAPTCLFPKVAACRRRAVHADRSCTPRPRRTSWETCCGCSEKRRW